MNKSESIKELAAALAKAQADIKAVGKDRTNPHFKNKYATLDAIMDAVRPVLAKCGLSVIQSASEAVQGFTVTTTLLHSSGEWIESVVPVPVSKQDAQGVGSAITYGRRYGVSALLALATDEDDDGQAAAKAKPEAQKPAPKPERVKPETSLEAAMTYPYEGKGEYHGKPLGEVPPEVLAAAHDAAHAANNPKFAPFIEAAQRVLAFHRGAK
jgi:hypothetical protein